MHGTNVNKNTRSYSICLKGDTASLLSDSTVWLPFKATLFRKSFQAAKYRNMLDSLRLAMTPGYLATSTRVGFLVDKGAFGQVFARYQGFSKPTVSLYDSREPVSECNCLKCFILLAIAFQRNICWNTFTFAAHDAVSVKYAFIFRYLVYTRRN